MSLWSRLFGNGDGGEKTAPPAEVYRDFSIFPEPVKEAGGYRIAARIEKEVDGQRRRHDMIRADVCSNLDEAASMTLSKAKSLIDEQGDAIFN